MEIVLVIVVAILVVALAVVVLRGRQSGGTAGADDQRTRAAQLEVQLAERDQQLSEALSERDTARAERDELRDEREAALRKLAAVEAEHEARTEELAKAREELETQFKGIAADVSKANSEAFLKQAKEQFENQKKLSEADLKQRQQAIDELVKPVKENLAKFEKQVTEMEKDRKGAYDVLRTQVGQLRDTAQGLSEALRSPQMRGQWGEQQLRNILELSGLSERIDFVEQDTIDLGESRGRPDAVVHIPGGLEVVIDAKTPLSSYLDAHHADDEQRQGELLNSHANSLLGHAKTLGDRDYASAVDGSPDFVVMFVPAEPILDAAMDVKPTLWEDAWQKHRVLIATPGLLLAFLRTVAVAWQQQDLQENAQKIANGAADLYDSLRIYAGHVDGVGKGLNRAVDAYNRSIGSLEGRVLPRARKFEDWGVVAGSKQIESAASVEAIARPVAAPELVEAEAEPTMPELSEGEDD
ncbi:MAG: DNA recombination protein RmuC [Acidimicrobiia bacterium]|nr:DNA recombination protein RmuC [Acidimicrobiia bacterium]MYB72934.1 DNA recombination protein RmuC [Acidimicrobiia bacterium]MYH99008.1 DNA recombination protein RmuC [Acidimicrobiia bacterium]